MSKQAHITLLLTTDQQRSVLNAIDVSQVHPCAYVPYGYRAQQCSLLAFNGELPDPVTRHYHLGNGYRQYSPTLMRFNSPDSPCPFGAGGLNAYAYCLGDPVNRTDKSGRTPSVVKSVLRALGVMRKPRKQAATTTGQKPPARSMRAVYRPLEAVPTHFFRSAKTPYFGAENPNYGLTLEELFYKLNQRYLDGRPPPPAMKKTSESPHLRTTRLLMNRPSRSLGFSNTPEILAYEVDAFTVQKRKDPINASLLSIFANDPDSPHARVYAAMTSELFERPNSNVLKTIRTGGLK